MPALGAPELIIILVIIVLIFGVGKLPEVGSALGKGIKEFRKSTDDLSKDDETEKPTAAVEAPRPQPALVEPPRQMPAASSVPRSAPEAVESPRAASAAGVAPTQADGTMAYTVKSGDTLDSVAERHGVTPEALMLVNGYSQRDRVLYPGDRLQVPPATKA